MCITLPTKVLAINGQKAKVEIIGNEREIYIPFENVSVGDWILVYAGCALAVMPEKDALEALAYLNSARGSYSHT